MEKVIVSGLLIIASVVAATITVLVLSSISDSDQDSIFDSNRIATDVVGTGIDGVSAIVEDGSVISVWFKNVGTVDIEPVLAMDLFLLSGDGLTGRYIPFSSTPTPNTDRWSVLVPMNPGVWPRGDTIQIRLNLEPATPITHGNYMISLTAPNGVSGEISFEYGAVPLPTETPPPQFTLTTIARPIAGGTLTGGGTYARGRTVTVTATPTSGYVFSRWFGACTGSGACNVTMDEDKTVTANFLNEFTLSTVAVPIAGGTVAGGGNYRSGTPVVAVAIPNSGYSFTGWSGACSGTGQCNVVMNSNKVLTANFSQP